MVMSAENPRKMPLHLRSKSRPHCGRLTSETLACGRVCGAEVSSRGAAPTPAFILLPLSYLWGRGIPATNASQIACTAFAASGCGRLPVRRRIRRLRRTGALTRGAVPAAVVSAAPVRTFAVEHHSQAFASAAHRSDLLHPEWGGWCSADCRFACARFGG